MCILRISAHFARNSRLSLRFYLQRSFGITTDFPPSPKFFLSSIVKYLVHFPSLAPVHCLVMQFCITIKFEA